MSDQGQDQTDDQDRDNKNSWLQVLGVPSHLFSSTPDDDDDTAAATESSAGSSDDSTQGSATQPSAVTQSSSSSAAPAGGQSSEDFAAGYQDGLSGGDANPGPRIDDALTDYEEGYAKGHDEFGHGASSAIGPPPAPSLDEQYRTALQAENWQSAAEFLNGFDHDDIQSRLSELTPDMVASLHQGALDNPRLGVNSQVAQMTRDPNARDPNEDDPNTIYAGEHFKIKMLEGVSFGEVAGATSVTFAVWDTDNNRAAIYEYVAVIVTAGTPVSFSGEGDWAEFSISPPRQVDQLSCNATHGAVGAGPLGIMPLNLDWATAYIPTGNTEGGGIESGGGFFSLTSGTVKLFKGP